MNNGDKIRAMTDEELAGFIEQNNFDADEHRYDYWIAWVKAEEDKDGNLE